MEFGPQHGLLNMSLVTCIKIKMSRRSAFVILPQALMIRPVLENILFLTMPARFHHRPSDKETTA